MYAVCVLVQIQHATAVRLCMRCKECPGFQYNAVKQNICRECGHSSVHHKVSSDDGNQEDDSIPALFAKSAAATDTRPPGSPLGAS